MISVCARIYINSRSNTCKNSPNTWETHINKNIGAIIIKALIAESILRVSLLLFIVSGLLRYMAKQQPNKSSNAL